MRRTVLASLLLLVLAPAMATPAELRELRFKPPAQLGPDIGVSHGEWLLLVFSDETASSTVLEFPSGSMAQEFREVQVDFREPDVGHYSYPVPLPALPASSLPPVAVNVSFPAKGPASLYVEAERIEWRVEGSDAVLDVKPQDMCLQPFVGPERADERAGRFNELCPASPLLIAARPRSLALPVRLHAEGVSVVEWHNAETSCDGAPEAYCPDGGIREEENRSMASAYVHHRVLGFQRISSLGGSVDLQGSAIFALGGGRHIDVSIDGSLRLPSASAQGCASCLVPDGQTLRADGDLHLAGLHQASDGWLRANMSGDFRSARFDEEAIDPRLLGGALLVGGAVAAGAIALLVKALAGLFTRVWPERALEHPNRRRVLEAVCQQPGLTYRALMVTTGMSDGGVRNHLKHLERTGHIVGYRHGQRLLYFENHGRFATTWQSHAVLRDPLQRSLLDWLLRHPGSSQSEAATYARTLGLTRTPVQRRLNRLVEDGLLRAKRTGRTVTYTALRGPKSK